MIEQLPTIYLVAHCETAWSPTGQYNGMTDLPLSPQGEAEAHALKKRLHGLQFRRVFTSPLQRVQQTCELAGFGAIAEIDSELREWNFGNYEGLTDAEIRTISPDWNLFRDGCPHGESPEDVTRRADNVVERLRQLQDDALVFSSTCFIRALGVRWVGLGLAMNARRFVLSAASLSIVGYQNGLSRPVIRLWNDTLHTQRVGLQHKAAKA